MVISAPGNMKVDVGKMRKTTLKPVALTKQFGIVIPTWQDSA